MMENGLSAADVAAVTNNGYGGMGGFGGEGWWVIVLLLALGGGRGFGFSGGGNYATPADVNAAVDQQTLIAKLDGQTYGVANLGYALNNTITNGFADAELSRARMAADQAKCCCETQRLIERGFCDVINNQNTNTRAIMDALVADRLAAKDEKICEQSQKILALQFNNSQMAQNAYLINTLRPTPIPAYISYNPFEAVTPTTPAAGA